MAGKDVIVDLILLVSSDREKGVDTGVAAVSTMLLLCISAAIPIFVLTFSASSSFSSLPVAVVAFSASSASCPRRTVPVDSVAGDACSALNSFP